MIGGQRFGLGSKLIVGIFILAIASLVQCMSATGTFINQEPIFISFFHCFV